MELKTAAHDRNTTRPGRAGEVPSAHSLGAVDGLVLRMEARPSGGDAATAHPSLSTRTRKSGGKPTFPTSSFSKLRN